MFTTPTYRKLKNDLTDATERKVTKQKMILYQLIFIADCTHQPPLVRNSTVYQKFINLMFHFVQLSHQETQLPTSWHNI